MNMKFLLHVLLIGLAGKTQSSFSLQPFSEKTDKIPLHTQKNISLEKNKPDDIWSIRIYEAIHQKTYPLSSNLARHNNLQIHHK